MNNQKKEITSGAFTIRFILAFIVAGIISGIVLSIILAPLQNLILLQDNLNGTTFLMYSVIIAIVLIVYQWIYAFFTTKLSLLNATVKKEDAFKAKRNMKIFLGIGIFLSVIAILGILLIVLIPVLQRQINNPTGNIGAFLIPIGILTLGFIINAKNTFVLKLRSQKIISWQLR